LERRNPDMRRPKSITLYRWFQPLSTEILLVMMARTSKEHVRQWVSLYITHLRDVQPILTGHDLEEFGLDAGPNFRTILDDLLYARLDERVTTEEEERDLVQRKYL
jgi:tRNA nucleotidyltransferase (CCA-adding enzyme)